MREEKNRGEHHETEEELEQELGDDREDQEQEEDAEERVPEEQEEQERQLEEKQTKECSDRAERKERGTERTKPAPEKCEHEQAIPTERMDELGENSPSQSSSPERRQRWRFCFFFPHVD